MKSISLGHSVARGDSGPQRSLGPNPDVASWYLLKHLDFQRLLSGLVECTILLKCLLLLTILFVGRSSTFSSVFYCYKSDGISVNIMYCGQVPLSATIINSGPTDRTSGSPKSRRQNPRPTSEKKYSRVEEQWMGIF